MGMDSHASIGYGFKLDEEFIENYLHEDNNEGTDEDDESFDNDDLDYPDLENILEPGLDFIYHGTYEDNTDTYLVIKASVQEAWGFEGSKKLNLNKIKEDPAWDTKLKAFAKKHKIKSPKIGWRLCCRYS